jgi:hypothetical protein
MDFMERFRTHVCLSVPKKWASSLLSIFEQALESVASSSSDEGGDAMTWESSPDLQSLQVATPFHLGPLQSHFFQSTQLCSWRDAHLTLPPSYPRPSRHVCTLLDSSIALRPPLLHVLWSRASGRILLKAADRSSTNNACRGFGTGSRVWRLHFSKRSFQQRRVARKL